MAKYGTVTAASEHLHVTQPSISRQLQRLERDLGVSLLERQGTRLALTRAGQQMHEVLEDIVIRADRAISFARQIADGSLAQIRMAAGPSNSVNILAPFIATLDENDPIVTVDVTSPDQIAEAVVSGHDIGISTSPMTLRTLQWKELTELPLRLFVGSQHPWHGRASASIDDITDQTLILPPIGSPLRSRLEAEFMIAGATAKEVIVDSEPLIRQSLAAAGRGVAMATGEDLFSTHSMDILDRNLTPITSTIYACWSPEHYGAVAIEQFVDRLAAFIAGKSPMQ